MFKKIAGTFFTRTFSAGISFIVLIITAKILGAEIRGNISLLILGVSVIAMVSQIAGGPALIYLIPKTNVSSLAVVSYIWALLSCILFSFALSLTGFIPADFFWHLLIISLLQCLGYIHLVILLGKEKIHLHNLIIILQVLLQITSLLFYIFITGEKTFEAFVKSLYISNVLTYVLSFIAISRHVKGFEFGSAVKSLKIMFRNGIYTQVASLTHLLSIRMSYYYINLFSGTAAVGVFSTGVSLTEAVLLVSASVSMVVYARIANSNDREYSQKLTIRLSKICFIITLPVLLGMILLPAEFYTLLFGSEFYEVKDVIIALSCGISALSFSMIYSHYFSGIGKYHINTIGSTISFIIMLTGGYLIIPIYGIAGAGWVSSIAYTAAAIFHFLVFQKHSGAKALNLLPSFRDISFIHNYVLNLRKAAN
jgi:O-antigen/teichoic acid export membrane protein